MQSVARGIPLGRVRLEVAQALDRFVDFRRFRFLVPAFTSCARTCRARRGDAHVTVGHAGSALVDLEQAADRGESGEKSSLGRNLPIQLDVRDHIDGDEVGGPSPTI